MFCRRAPNPRTQRGRLVHRLERLADTVLAEAETSRAKGRRVSALSSYLRASNYFRAAYTFLIGAPVDPRVVDSYRRHRAAFESAAALMSPAAERIAIPYAGARCTATCSAPRTTVSPGQP
jgi:hypothetical protein